MPCTWRVKKNYWKTNERLNRSHRRAPNKGVVLITLSARHTRGADPTHGLKDIQIIVFGEKWDV